MTDQEFSNKMREAADALNALMRRATEAGLVVEIDDIPLQTVGLRPRPFIVIRILRPIDE